MREGQGQAGGEWTDHYAYSAGVAGGNDLWAGAFLPPSTFLDNAKTEAVYLPDPNAGQPAQCEVVIFHNRADAIDPRSRSDFSHYPATEQSYMGVAPGVKTFLLHTPGQATINGNTATWQTPGGQTVTFVIYAPGQKLVTVQDTASAYATYIKTTVPPSEQQWQLWQAWDTSQGAEPEWLTSTDVCYTAQPGFSVSTNAVASTDGSVEGVQVHRGTYADYLCLFNATAAKIGEAKPYTIDYLSALLQAGWVENGFTVNFTTSTTACHILLTGLDPAKNWTASVDGTPSQPLSVSANGVSEVVVNNPLTHTLVVSHT
jgi:hypothetical protein